MKKIFLLFLLFFCTMQLASAQNVTVGDYSIGIGEEATVPITVLDAENVAGGVVKITFDPAVVSAQEAVAGDFLAFMPLIDNSDGWVKLVAASANAVNKNEAVLARIVFKGAAAGATDIRIEYASLNDGFGMPLTSGIRNGSITVTSGVVEQPYIYLKALSSRKTVDNINSSHSIGIFNGQNKVDTFDLIVLNHNMSSVAALNQSSITMQPWESREVTLNVTDETPGEYFVTVKARSQSNVNIADEVTTKTIVQESFSIDMASLEGTVTSIGANITYLLTIQNNQNILDTLALSSSGIDPSWISFDAIHQLSAGEQKTIPIKITIPDTAGAGSFTLSMSAKSSNVGTLRASSLPLTVQNGPVLSGLVPENNIHLGADDVIFSWITNMNSTTKLILNQRGVETVYTGDEGIYHSVIVENLTRNQWYTYRVASNTSHGSTQSDERSFYIDNGVSFTQKIYDFNIERDYDQRVAVTVKNTDSTPHEILLSVNSTNPELIVGFVGEGSIDEIITLAPDEAKDVALALHAQDALHEDYYLLLNLTTDNNITDNAIANINVRQPDIDLRFEELSTDPQTLTKTIRITNHGDSVTDLNIYGSGGLKENVMFDPIVTHGYLRGGSSITFEAVPLLSLDFTGMRGDIVAEAAGVNTSFPVNFTLPAGMEVYYGSVPNVTIEFSDYFDNDNSPNTNPREGALVESYLTNGNLIFFSQVIVDVYQDGEPVSNANVTLQVWNSNGKAIILKGVSDLGGKALFSVFGKADDYSYKAILEDYKVETEVRNFSVDRVNPLYEIYPDNITWSIISDSNSSFYNFSEPVVLDNAPFCFKATKNVIEANESFILDLRWKLDPQKQVTIPGSIDGNNITFGTGGIPFGNYTATIVSTFNKTISLSETINLTVVDVNGMQKQNNYTFWVPFPVNKTHMATLNIEHEVLSEDSTITFDLNDVGTNNHNKSEYLFEYYILSNESKTENVEISVVTQRGLLYSYMAPISLEADVPSFINITIPVNYPDGTRIETMNLSASMGESKSNINVTPKIQYIYEKRIWVGADRGIIGFAQFKDVLISCGSSFAWELTKDAAGEKWGKAVIYTWDFAYENVYTLCKGIIENDFDGVAEGATSEVIDTVELMGMAPGLGTASSVFWCLEDWYDVGIEAGIHNDIRDIGIFLKYKLHNWYCTNRPIVSSDLIISSLVKPAMSPTPNIKNGYLIENFYLKKALSSYRTHDVFVYMNDMEIGSLMNVIPDGHYIFEFNSSDLNYADQGTSTNAITLKTRHLNGGHYAVNANMQVIIPMKKMSMYVVASDQIEANEIIKEMSSALSNSADLGIYAEDIDFLKSESRC